jgi:hypothetical protein
MTRATGYLGRVLALISCALALVAAAGSGRAVSTGDERVKIVLLALETPEGREGVLGPTYTAGSANAVIETGSSKTFYLAIDRSHVEGATEESRCATLIGSLTPSDDPAKQQNIENTYAHVWWVRVRPLPTDFGEVTVEVEWERVESSGRGESEVVAGDRAKVKMREGERHLFDFIQYVDETTPACRRNTTVGFTASIAEDPALADAVLTYDLWVRHAPPRGDEVVRRFRGTGRQGEEVQFSFAPLRFPVSGVTLADGSKVDVVLEILGSLRGRVRSDGAIDLNLSATRWVNLVPSGTASRGGTAGRGRKVVTVVAGETVALGLPVPTGSAGVSPTVSRGATDSGKLSESGPDEIVVNYDDFFAGHVDDLILTVTRD